ncbi:amino acid permease [Modestobacter versicolor]|uniref:APA family basic amino acid/polyamine antiporter n=1 Tax=Modestobacter versicolor TaxID=429133 RepID=A0A323V774_9ACTN|nr:amino acid permease [Modestobacter versicolor]MBB3674985.1 APA family basic amino acid/polyamine antiporter [Modestobacter versicolor]PZA20622.1 amino acid permease [Modestobacter versicolor]
MQLFRTKSLEAIQSDVSGDDGGGGQVGHLRKRLSARHLIGFGIGVVIGTGIFTLTGIQARETAGPAVVVSFAIAGLVALLAGLCYAELASSVPTAGSAYTYAYATTGELLAWVIGWDLFLEFAFGAAVVARGWSAYIGNLLDLPTSLFGEEAPVNVGAAAIVVVLTLVAVLGIRESARVTNVLVLVKVAVCVFVVVTGIWFVKGANLTPFVPAGEPTEGSGGLTQPLISAIAGLEPATFGIGGVLTAAAVVFFAYTGFEAVANLSEETRKPSRDIPLGLLGTLGVATALYIGVAFVVVGMVEYTDIDAGAPIADAFDQVGLGWASALISIAAVAGLTSVILVDLVTVSRIGFAMGRDGLLPQSIARVSPRTGTPVRMTLLYAVLVLVAATFVKLESLANLVSIGTLFAFVLVSAAVPVLRRTRPDLPRAFRVPFSPIVPVLSALACLYLMLNLEVETWLRFLAWLLIGLVVYAGYGRRHSRLRDQPQQAAVGSR